MDPTAPAITGLIDIHSHVLPGVDDGCIDIEDSLSCVELLRQQGFVGSICTPHIWPRMFPDNTPQHVAGYVAALQRALSERGVSYRLWPGGELRLFADVIDWLKANGVPTLASSNCVLVDLWENKWPRWANKALDWLLEQGHQPILAHPERMNIRNLDSVLRDVERRGIWLQGNLRPMTGEEGYHADQTVRRLLTEGRYQFLALDMHGSDDLHNRLDGMALAEAEFGVDTVKSLMHDAPRRRIRGLDADV